MKILLEILFQIGKKSCIMFYNRCKIFDSSFESFRLDRKLFITYIYKEQTAVLPFNKHFANNKF